MVPSVDLVDMTPMLRPERNELLSLLRGLRPGEWELPTECPAWNVKGIALHILGDDLSLLGRQRDASTNSIMLYAADHPGLSFRDLLDGFNEQWVTASQFLSTELAIELLRLVGDWSEEFYRDVGLETTSGEPVGLFAAREPSPYWQVIAREYLERFVHQSQIRRAVGATDLGDELATAVGRVVVHLLAAWMRDYAPPDGATIAIDFGAAGGWTWERVADRWSVREAFDHTAAALIAVSHAAAVAMLSRGFSPEQAVSHLTISGDESLARGAIDIIAPLVGQPQP